MAYKKKLNDLCKFTVLIYMYAFQYTISLIFIKLHSTHFSNLNNILKTLHMYVNVQITIEVNTYYLYAFVVYNQTKLLRLLSSTTVAV